jgi:hypothetical protein
MQRCPPLTQGEQQRGATTSSNQGEHPAGHHLAVQEPVQGLPAALSNSATSSGTSDGVGG